MNTAVGVGDARRRGPDPTDDDTAEVDEVAPAIGVDKTVYAGHDAGASCAGSESVAGVNGDAVTYCFAVTNTGDTDLADVAVDDADLGIDQGDMTVLSGDLSPVWRRRRSVELFYETTIDGDLVNTATVTARRPSVGADPTDDDTAEVDEVGPGDQRSTRRCTRVMTTVRRVRARSRSPV